MEKKERFRQILAEGMAKHRLTEQQLADELGMDRYWRKWLRRLVKDGLERSNAKSHDMLERLADRLGFGSAKRIWLGYADPNLAAIEEFKKLWAISGSDMRREIEQQIIKWKRTLIAELLANEKFFRGERCIIVNYKPVWRYDLSDDEAFAKLVLGNHRKSISQTILDIINEKNLSPELPPPDIWQHVRPDLIRIVRERINEAQQKRPDVPNR